MLPVEQKPASQPIPRWGPAAEVSHGLIAWNQRGPAELSHLLSQHLILCSFTPSRDRETRLAGSSIRCVNSFPGACEIVPAGADYWARWHHHKEVMTFAVDARWLQKLAQEQFGADHVEMETNALPLTDERVVFLSQLVRSEFQASKGYLSDLYVDSALVLLGTHLLRKHSSVAVREEPVRRKALAPKRLANVLEYMHANLHRSVSLSELSAIAGCSPNYFVTAFKIDTGTSPHRYLIGLRLDRAQSLLERSQISIAEIAAATSFSGQSHLTAMMQRERGMTPAAYRNLTRER